MSIAPVSGAVPGDAAVGEPSTRRFSSYSDRSRVESPERRDGGISLRREREELFLSPQRYERERSSFSLSQSPTA